MDTAAKCTPRWGQAERYRHCSLESGFQPVIQQWGHSNIKTGGLGKLMAGERFSEGVPAGFKFEVWLCVRGHECAGCDPTLATEEDCSSDWFCFAYDEENEEFVPWGPNRHLRLIANAGCDSLHDICKDDPRPCVLPAGSYPTVRHAEWTWGDAPHPFVETYIGYNFTEDGHFHSIGHPEWYKGYVLPTSPARRYEIAADYPEARCVFEGIDVNSGGMRLMTFDSGYIRADHSLMPIGNTTGVEYDTAGFTYWYAMPGPQGTRTYNGESEYWCSSDLDLWIGSTQTARDCWTKCEALFGKELVAVDWWYSWSTDHPDPAYDTIGDCYCQNACECMSPHEGLYVTITRDFTLPEVCAPEHDCEDGTTFSPQGIMQWSGSSHQCYAKESEPLLMADLTYACRNEHFMIESWDLIAHDSSKCSDRGDDCCASETWGEAQTCRDGYLPKPVPPEDCLSTYKNCVMHERGIGCYGCFPPDIDVDAEIKCYESAANTVRSDVTRLQPNVTNGTRIDCPAGPTAIWHQCHCDLV